MIPEIRNNAAKVTELCQRFCVRRLELFGSAATDQFDPARSDIDFLVQYQNLEPGQAADVYFGFLEALEDLFHRPIDLVMIDAVKSPHFLQAVNRTRIVLYAA